MIENRVIHPRRPTAALPAAFLAAVALLGAVPPAEAQIQTGGFVEGDALFFNGASTGVIPPAGMGDMIQLDTDGDGIVDTDFAPPGDLEPAMNVSFAFGLSPTQRTLYVKKWGAGVCGGSPNVLILLYDVLPLASPPKLEPFTSSQGPACLSGDVVRQPSFWEQSGPVRTMVLVGEGTLGSPQVLWADLVAHEYAVDSSSYVNDIGVIRFAPSGNAALITHDIQTGQNGGVYNFIDLCANPLGGGLSAPQSWAAGIPSARVIEPASGVFEAEFLVDGAPQPGSQFALSTACYGSGPVGCCQVGSGCSTAASPAACSSTGGTPVPSACPGGDCCADVECVEACCLNGACSLVDRLDCGSSGGSLPQEASCATATCPEAIEKCCVLDGSCYDTTESTCLSFFPPGTVQGIGTQCGVGPACPALHLQLTKDGPTTVSNGETFDYTIHYQNDGDVTAPAVTVQDLLPWNLQFVSASAGGVENFGTVEWQLGDLAVGSPPPPLTVTVKAGCHQPGELLSNQAAASSSGLPFYSNVWESIALGEALDPLAVSVLSTPSDGLPVEGNDTITHAITLTNTTGETRRDVMFSIRVGSGLTLESLIDDGGGTVQMSTPTSWDWTGDLAPLATATVVVISRVEDCIQQTSVELKSSQVTTLCGTPLGDLPGEVFPVRRAVEVDVLGVTLYPPTTLETFTYSQRMQVLRDGSTVDFQLVVSNPHPTPLIGASARVSMPVGFTAVGNPPFVPPTDPAAVWNAGSGRIDWSGDLAVGQTVTITFRAMENGTSTATNLSGQAAQGSCTIYSTERLGIVPQLPAAPYLIALKDGRLATVRPGIDTADQTLLGFSAEYVEGLGRGAGGDLWVVSLPTFRFNPETLELDGYPLSLFADLGLNPTDVAVDPADGTLVFGGTTFDALGFSKASLRRFDPLTGAVTVLFDEAAGPFSAMQGVGDLVVEPGGAIGVVSTTARLYRFDPVAGTMTDLSDPTSFFNYAALDDDQDGSYLTTQAALFGNVPMADVTPADGTHDVFAPDLQTLIPTAWVPAQAVAAGDNGDVYFSYQFSGLGVIHRQPSVSGEELLPISGASGLLQLEFVSAGLCSDGDGDGFDAGPGCSGGSVDCDDADPAVHPGAGELNDGKDNQCPGDPGYGVVDELAGTAGFTVPGDPSQLCWPAQPGATQYEVIRSPAPDFSVGCVSFATAGSCWTETGSPATGVTWHYLVRPVAPFVGSWGQDAGGNERTIVCP